MSFCECDRDGFCTRYQRDMGGRMRELCAGVNVDLGTAAAFREQWSREAGVATHSGPSRPLILKSDQAAGDAVAMTAAIYSLHQAHPGKYATAVESKYPEVYQYNPDVTPLQMMRGVNASEVQMHYPAIHQSNHRGIHFMQGWCEFLGAALGVDVPLLTNRPHLYFGEPVQPDLSVWLVCSGGKSDFTNKLWGHHNYQAVVSALRGEVQFVQVGGADGDHPRLDGACDLVGKTTLRQTFDLARSCRGVLCGVSLMMHVAAALEKPAVVIAGGREPVQWNSYPKQTYIHTVGALPCTDPQGVGGACWRSRVVPLGDGTVMDRDTCQRPVEGLPECMTLISPLEVVAAILRYNR